MEKDSERRAAFRLDNLSLLIGSWDFVSMVSTVKLFKMIILLLRTLVVLTSLLTKALML